ncbi:putative peroxiredoxin 6 [Cardiosporidium cionae]|uniref:Peroxiredoxin 6 n=1 Tax=Cardiosporidium cionae TaxID=476202 RepID=A0ABQ7J405_9APIC|nr:putative peroxiredoxin 6 [Cardiosporidium cionae]|eukprot:KAF8817846.1 putative peroxiredoxin 6 [Cardiosporidium cionae]
MHRDEENDYFYEAIMGFHLGTIFPNFECDAFGCATRFNFYDYIQESWAILFSHPADFTPVCTTELGKACALVDEFTKRGCKLVALSCSSLDDHEAWTLDVMSFAGLTDSFKFPIISDPDRTLATKLGIMDAEEKDKKGLPLTCRCVFFIGPDKKVKASVLYPASTGRSMSELLRVLDSLQVISSFPVATPEGWENGKNCMVVPSLSDEIASITFPKGIAKIAVPSGKNYMRQTADPRIS